MKKRALKPREVELRKRLEKGDKVTHKFCIISIGDRRWGRGQTIAEADAAWRGQGNCSSKVKGKSDHILVIGDDDAFIDAYGNLNYKRAAVRYTI